MTPAVFQTWLLGQSGPQLAGSLYFLGAQGGIAEGDAFALRDLAVSAYEEISAHPTRFQTEVAKTLSGVAALFGSPEQIAHPVRNKLIGEIPFNDLQRQLKNRVAQLDLDGAVKLFFAGGIFSREVSNHFVTEFGKPRGKSHGKSPGLFLRRLIRLVTDPEMNAYSSLRLREGDPHDRALFKFTQEANWRMTDLFGRLTILNQEEAHEVSEGNLEEILSPHLQWELEEIVEAELEEELDSPADLPVSSAVTEGALMVLRTLPVKQEIKIASYSLLRRYIFSLMAAERFQDAAEMLVTLREPEILARLFQDLQALKGKIEDGFANASAFYRETASFTGLALAFLPVGEAAHILEVVVKEGRFSSPWLIRMMASIRPDQLTGLFSPGDELPHLSAILGTLIENKITRVRMHSILELALDPDAEHQKEPLIYEALDRLHERYPAFVQPQRMIADDFSTLFDEKLAARIITPSPLACPEQSRRVGEGNLATRQEVLNGLREKLQLFFSGDWVRDKKWPLLSSRILLTLAPSEVWRLPEFKKTHLSMSRSEILAHLLLVQESDVVAAFFTAWGEEILEEERIGLGRVLTTLWKISGEKGKRLVTETVREALKDPKATVIFQKMLSEHGSDGELMMEQMEIYMELADPGRLGSGINPYEIFVATGILKPEDLEGKFRKEALSNALSKLKGLNEGDLDSRRRISDALIQMNADERQVVAYFAARLGDEANEAFHVLDQLGPRGQKKLVTHIRGQSTRRVLRKLPGGAATGGISGLDVPSYEMSEEPISLKGLLQRFPITSRAVQKYLLDKMVIDETGIVRKLAELGDSALILLSPKVIQDWGALTRTEPRGEPREGLSWEKMIPSPIFPSLVELAEAIATPKSHAALVDLYEFVKIHNGAADQAWLVIRALAGMELRPDFADFFSKEIYLDYFIRFYRNAGKEELYLIFRVINRYSFGRLFTIRDIHDLPDGVQKDLLDHLEWYGRL